MFTFRQRKFIFQLILWTVTLLGIIVQIQYYGALPEKVAVHFNALGQADIWASKGQFLWTNILLFLAVAILFQSMILSLPKLPAELLNIPKRRYWLSPQRKEATLRYVMRFLLWIADLTMLFLFGVSYLITQANYYRTNRLSSTFWILFFLYIVAITVLTVSMLVHFLILPKSKSPTD